MKDNIISVKLEKKFYEKIKKYTKENKITQSDFIRDAIKNSLLEKEKEELSDILRKIIKEEISDSIKKIKTGQIMIDRNVFNILILLNTFLVKEKINDPIFLDDEKSVLYQRSNEKLKDEIAKQKQNKDSRGRRWAA